MSTAACVVYTFDVRLTEVSTLRGLELSRGLTAGSRAVISTSFSHPGVHPRVGVSGITVFFLSLRN